MQISGLPASSTFGAADVLAIEINGVTYKVTGATLAAALQSMGDYVTAQDIANNLTTTDDGYVLDARQGKALLDALEALGDPVEIAHGGTGTATPPTRGGVIYGASGTAFGSTPAGTAGQFLRSTGANTPQWATVDKATIGLGNVDNTSDANKPVSAAQQTAINAVKDIADNSVHFNEEQTLSAIEQAQARANIDAASTSDVEAVEDMIDDEKARIDALEEIVGSKRYGVSGIGQRASALTRMWDAVSMMAQVGTDGDNSAIVNDFDNVTPFNRRKCVGRWHVVNGRAQFKVLAYQGDANYAEDGSMGDYVAVECPRAYYYLHDGTLGVSAHQWAGWRPFDIFCKGHNPENTMPFVYLPAYALALKDGKAVSLPGLDNLQGNYKELMDACRTYGGGSLGTEAFLQPMAVNFYEWALFTVEFAQQNCQNVMYGCASLRHNNDDRATLRSDSKWLLSNYQAARVVGEYISLQPTNVDINTSTYYASHKITALTRCDAEGNASSSGAYTLMETEDLGVGREYTVGSEYRIAARPYRTGACDGVSTPSGSPVSNSNGYYPMKYRWRENVYSNQYKTISDFFNQRMGTGDDDYYLDWYYLPDPAGYTPSSSSKPDATDLASDKFLRLDVGTAHANYGSGYIKSKKYSEEYPDLWIPYVMTDGSASTYYADYAYLVYSHVVRSVRLGGLWNSGTYGGFSYLYGPIAPSAGSANYGGDLFINQWGVNAA